MNFRKLIGAVGLMAVFATFGLHAPAQTAKWTDSQTMISAVGSTTTGTYPSSAGVTTAGSTANLFHVVSASTSSATVYFEQSIDGSNWYRSATISNPTSVGELWACPAALKARFNLAVHASGTISAFFSSRAMPSDPIGTSCKKIDVADAGSTFSMTSPTFGSSIVLDQSTGDYTFTWANPAAARAISIVDPGGTDVFAWVDATQTLTNKTLTSPTLTTPSLGVATATSINKVTITAPATGSTLTIADGDTLTVNGAITLTGTDAKTYTFPTTDATVARTDAAQTFTGSQTFSSPIIGALKTTPNAYAIDGAISVAPQIALLTKAGIGAYTLAAPTATTHDGYQVCAVSTTANAHVITFPIGTINGGTNVTATYGGAIGDAACLVAYQGVWYTTSTINITVAP